MNAIAGVTCVAGLALAAPAVATEAETPNAEALLGQWAFETEPYDVNCQMTGSMTLASSQVAGQFSCSLTTLEVCGPLRFQTRQICTATLAGDRLVVLSELEYVDPDPTAYAPDNFVLDTLSSFEMEGSLRSADIAPVRFYRPIDGVS